jgi:hypothetical protein
MKPAKFFAALAVSGLLITPSFADDAPLPAGKPAGAHDAALLGISALTFAIVGGFAAILIVAGAGGFSSGKSPSTNTVTTTTGTSS